MNTPLRLLIHGASGRMGQALQRLAADNPLLTVAASTGRSDIHSLQNAPEFDVAIDFSSPEGFDAVLALCLARKKPLVSGTTGLSAEQFIALKTAGQSIAVLWASNFSLGVAVLNDLVQRTAQTLQSWGVEITETHHVHKLDSPSGTALSFGQSVANVAGQIPTYISHRQGEVIGDHTVKFSTPGEFIELRHNALNRDIFAFGALFAAEKLLTKVSGVYKFGDLL